MFIFLYGEDTYRLRQKLKEIVDYYQKIHRTGLNLKFYDALASTFQDFKDAFQQSPMFQEKKLIVLENIFLNQKFKEELLKEKDNFEKPQNVVVVVCQEGKVKENDKLLSFLKQNGKSQKFDLLDKYKLKNWLRKEFVKEGIKAEEGVFEKLIEFVGNDLWRMSNEIKKLANYKKSISEKIEKKDIELLVKSRTETDIFRTIEALAKKEKKKALGLIEKHLEKGDSPLYLLSMINYQFRNLLLLKSRYQEGESIGFSRISTLAKQLDMPFFVVKKSISLMGNFSFEELKKAYQKIFQADFNIKTGKVLPEEGIKMLVIEL